MKVSELITQLRTYLADYGDHEVEDSYGTAIEGPEWINDEDGDHCVLADKA